MCVLTVLGFRFLSLWCIRRRPHPAKSLGLSLLVGMALESEHMKFPSPLRRSSGWQAVGYLAWPLSPTTLAQHGGPGQLMPGSLYGLTPPAAWRFLLRRPFCPNCSLPLGAPASTSPSLSPEPRENAYHAGSLHPSLTVAALCPRKSMNLGAREFYPHPVRRSLRLSFLICRTEITGTLLAELPCIQTPRRPGWVT